MRAKLLIVDGDDFFLKELEKTLIFSGFDVRCAANGLDAIFIIEREAFDLIVTSLFVSFFNGNEVARHARLAQKKQPQIIGVSTKPWFFNRDEFDRVMSKNIPIEILAYKIKMEMESVLPATYNRVA